jgi:DNA-binding NarL/FixJ family response regulator
MMRIPSIPGPPHEATSPITVVLADDHPVVRTGVKNELIRHADIEVIGEAVNGDDALRFTRELHPRVLVLDINMPGLRAARVVREVRSAEPSAHVLILSAYGDLEYVLAMLRAGATGYLLKEEDPSAIVDAIRGVAKGETWLSSSVASSLALSALRENGEKTRHELTQREKEVLVFVAKGSDNVRIAESLSISEGTVKNHITNIYDKLGVQSRAEAVAWAWQHGVTAETHRPATDDEAPLARLR